jgi:hypothetical protein
VVLQVVLGWLLWFVKNVLVAAAVIVVVALSLFFLPRACAPARAASDCETFKVTGEADYLVAYRQDGAWMLSAPGEQSTKVREGQVLVIEPDAQLGVIAVLDSKGRAQARAYNWHIHGQQKRFCIK